MISCIFSQEVTGGCDLLELHSKPKKKKDLGDLKNKRHNIEERQKTFPSGNDKR